VAEKTNRWIINVYGILLLLLATVIVTVLSYAGVGSLLKQPITPVTGVSQFAVIYLMAQIVERVVEPFSNMPIFGESVKLQPADKKLSDKEKEDEQKPRTFSLWCFASFIAVIMCYFTAGLFQLAGVPFATGGHAVDSVLSGAIIGSGTKPLHDLIGYLQGKNP
jgi:hypothetical protein